jgi:hypothetical protein
MKYHFKPEDMIVHPDNPGMLISKDQRAETVIDKDGRLRVLVDKKYVSDPFRELTDLGVSQELADAAFERTIEDTKDKIQRGEKVIFSLNPDFAEEMETQIN